MTISRNLSVGREYRTTVGALAEAARRRDSDLARAELAHQNSAAAAAGELARARGDAAAADRWAGAAAAGVLEFDQEAARLWERLRRRGGWRSRGWGELPEPAHVEAFARVAAVADRPQRAAAHPGPARDSLARAAERIDRATGRASRRALPGRLLALLPLVGAVVAAATALVAAGLVTLGQGPSGAATVLRVLGWLAFLVAPSAGVVVAAYGAHHRLQARLDVGGVGLTLLGGMVSATALSLSFFAR